MIAEGRFAQGFTRGRVGLSSLLFLAVQLPLRTLLSSICLGQSLRASGRGHKFSSCPKARLHGCDQGGETALELRGLSEESRKGADLSGHEGDVLRDDVGGTRDTNDVADSAVVMPNNGQGVTARVVGDGIDLLLRQGRGVDLLRLEEDGGDVVHGLCRVGVVADTDGRWRRRWWWWLWRWWWRRWWWDRGRRGNGRRYRGGGG